MPSERDKERYELLSKSGISPADFYRQIREDGILGIVVALLVPQVVTH